MAATLTLDLIGPHNLDVPVCICNVTDRYGTEAGTQDEHGERLKSAFSRRSVGVGFAAKVFIDCLLF